MSNQTLPAFIQALMKPELYSHDVEQVDLVQTHISYVTLAGDFVYKWKKPMDFGFLNFSTIEKRKFYCEQELNLNKRLCPDLYLEVVTINAEGDGFALNGDGDVVEYGVKMARMDEEGMMSKLVSSENLSKSHLEKVVDAIVPFYEIAEGGSEIQKFGTSEAVAVNVIENFDQTEGFIGKGGLDQELFDSVKEYATDFLTKNEIFEKRIAAGKIRDCHGDLYSANICFDKKNTYVFDCIEFNERFRFGDVCADIGFLAMDLDFHGLDELATYFVEKYVEKSGDSAIWEVMDFYKCYRAYVRAKIGLFTASDPNVPQEVVENCLNDAAKYFQLAKRYANAG